MDMFSDIKSVMNDLNQRKAALGQQLNEFKELQVEINQLVERSDKDADAMAKLIKLKNAFPEGFEFQQAKVMNKVDELESHFKNLEQQFNVLGEIESAGDANGGNELTEEVSETELLNKVNNIKPKKVRSYM
ncbi:hypothetical protein Sps_01008 [Shewanella psychrophila]|uniref:Uncharacterized protein n=1 Tax=Shewanella psychrophila TaxID=225848 RepID=A0A1S6HL01_9GAMM|nr:hypothetical protein [Shewanella psychrophila]AQS36197.1 hypothetical protein Sps_01008 [Shewanella psychrophila]